MRGSSCTLPFVVGIFCLGIVAAGPAGEGKTMDVVVLKDVKVPMRDGVELATDLYLPAKDGRPLEGKFPVVLQRTPYDKENQFYKDPATFFASHGYLSVIQDCRGRFRSGGEFFPMRDEAEDGYDTVEWLARRPYSSGTVGTYGVSYMGWVQLQMATLNPPSLATMIPHTGPNNAYYYSMHVGGTRTLGLLRWHLHMATTSWEAQENPSIVEAIKPMLTSKGFLQWASRIPWRRGQTPLSVAPRYEDAAFQFYFDNVAGNLRAVLYASSDAPDTDFFVKLIDVYPASEDYPAGYAFPVTDGIIRARYRNSFTTPELMEPGTVYEIRLPIQPAANLFKAGHRIRVDISSSSFPNFDINRNTGDPLSRQWRIANNTIHHGGEHASFLKLPIQEGGP